MEVWKFKCTYSMERGEEMEEVMTDKQYEGMLKDNIACLDRLAKSTKEKDMLRSILYERKQLESKLGYEVPSNHLYDEVIEPE